MDKEEDIKNYWKERVYVETAEYVIKGYIYMPQLGKRSRIISEVLNRNKKFIAIKNCEVEYKLFPNREKYECDFMSVNVSTILIMRPC